MTKSEIDVFENFLKRNNVFTEFRAQCLMHNKQSYNGHVNTIEPAKAFGWAFSFADAEKETTITKRRWSELNAMWKVIATSISEANAMDNTREGNPDEPERHISDDDGYIMHTFESEPVRKVMSDDEVEVTTTSGYRFIVNPVLGETLRRLKLNKLSIREDSITGDMHLVFNKSQGVAASESEMKADKSGVRFNSKPLVEFLIKTFNITGKKHKLKIGDNQSRTADYYVCKVYNE